MNGKGSGNNEWTLGGPPPRMRKPVLLAWFFGRHVFCTPPGRDVAGSTAGARGVALGGLANEWNKGSGDAQASQLLTFAPSLGENAWRAGSPPEPHTFLMRGWVVGAVTRAAQGPGADGQAHACVDQWKCGTRRLS